MLLGRGFSSYLNKLKAFIREFAIDKVVLKSDSMVYINDSSLDFAIHIKSEQFYPFIELVLEYIPQHHYFYERNLKWCLVISMEGWVDFGFAPHSPFD